jgi:hypothetical protein
MGNVDTKLNFRKAVLQLTSKTHVSKIKYSYKILKIYYNLYYFITKNLF